MHIAMQDGNLIYPLLELCVQFLKIQTIEENLQEQLDSYGNFLIGQAEASLERIIQQLNLLKEQLEQRKKAITTASH